MVHRQVVTSVWRPNTCQHPTQVEIPENFSYREIESCENVGWSFELFEPLQKCYREESPQARSSEFCKQLTLTSKICMPAFSVTRFYHFAINAKSREKKKKTGTTFANERARDCSCNNSNSDGIAYHLTSQKSFLYFPFSLLSSPSSNIVSAVSWSSKSRWITFRRRGLERQSTTYRRCLEKLVI